MLLPVLAIITPFVNNDPPVVLSAALAGSERSTVKVCEPLPSVPPVVELSFEQLVNVLGNTITVVLPRIIF